MTTQIIEYLANVIKSKIPIEEVAFVGRKTQDGFTVEDGKYIGLTDKKGRYAYVRFNGEHDHTYDVAEGPTSSSDWYQIESELRLVAVVSRKDCTSARDVEATLARVMNSTKFPPKDFGKVNLILQSSSTNFEDIIIEETDAEKVSWPDHLLLVAVDFKIEYLSNECCDV